MAASATGNPRSPERSGNGYPVSEAERNRLASLRSYAILDTDPEKAFDDLTALAAYVCQTPISLISLVDEDRQWFKARIGISATETSRSVSFCTHAIEQRGLFVVPDALEDHRFANNPLVVSDPKIRFYAGAPLVNPEGYALGTLCVIDRKPRSLSMEQLEALAALSRQVEAQLELRRNLIALRHALQARDAAEAERERLFAELQHSYENVRRLADVVRLSSSCKLDVTIPADPDAISPVVDAVAQVARETKSAEGKEFEIEIALREALANAIVHGCRGDKDKKVECCVVADQSGELVVIVRDPGAGFDPRRVPPPTDGDLIYRTHGRGVYLINQLMDSVQFNSGPAGTEVRMRKR